MKRIVMGVTLRSRSGKSIYRDLPELSTRTLDEFLPPLEAVLALQDRAASAGLCIEAITPAGLTFSADSAQAQEQFGTRFEARKVPFIREFDRYVPEPVAGTIRNPFGEAVERVFVCKQSFELTTVGSAETPPELDYHHIDLPHDIQRYGELGQLRELGLNGQGVQVAMVDTGLHAHPYFAAQHASVRAVAGNLELDAARDERGHGTGMAAVLLAAAPSARLTMYKACSDHYGAVLPAFQKAATSTARIISCSWGVLGFEPQLYLDIVCAIAAGTVVIFSAGNGACDRPQAMFQTIAHPEVISVGGCYPRQDGSFEVADLSSSYRSELFPDRHAPDLCGICGMLPYGQLIVMPTEPGSIYDRNNGRRDGTAPDDGWFVSSGTSAAAAYVSGLAAVILAAKPKLNPSALRAALIDACHNVTCGQSYMREPARSHVPDPASGFGMVTGRGVLRYLHAPEATRERGCS